jgi:hypothetical protein
MATKKGAGKKGGGKKLGGTGRKRELIDTGRDKRYVRRDEKGRFDEVVDMGRSLAADRRSKAKTKVRPGYGDQGDVVKSSPSSSRKSTKKSGAKKGAKKSSSKKR